MKSLTLLWREAASELAARCGTSTSRDFSTVAARFEHEGGSFLTITLPTFAAALEKGLATGVVEAHDFPAFKRGRSGLPAFLQGFLLQVFEPKTGRLLDNPSVEAIHAIRQLTLMFGKIGLKCSQARETAAIDDYIECEKEVKLSDARLSSLDLDDFKRVTRLLWADVMADVDLAAYNYQLVPKHGPGTTADRLLGNQKWRQIEWPERLDAEFPYGEYCLPSWRFASYLDRVHYLEPGAERPVKVITVPKTQKKPRIIAVEPVAMQYSQQAIMQCLVRTIQSSDSDFGWLVGFTDQVPNQRLACEGSLTGALATLDMSEASDRVSNQLVRAMLRPHPHLFRGVDACRSRSADVPGHGVQRLAKFASMGSALTFPIEAMVFTAVLLIGVERAHSRRLSRRDVEKLRGRVRVYGDDMIVPVEYVQSCVETLEAFGLKVNHSKSFWTGKFRESCGKEYYDGQDVSIVRVRTLLPARRRCVADVVSTVSLRNRFYLAGMWRTARYLDGLLGPLLGGNYPTVMPGSSVLGRWSYLGYETQRSHPSLHAPLVRGYVSKVRTPASPLDGVDALLKVLVSKERLERPAVGEETPLLDPFWQLLNGREPAAERDHLQRNGRAEVVSIKLGWHSPLVR